ncbi:MAG: HAMP domain-containing protein [Solirubrobacterales bacterium]|nr:HAMP domain-containing protein [Solirubrobacterales bacterium]HMT05756.1 ATP-binding protein [Solirubrobacterales bacterium]
MSDRPRRRPVRKRRRHIGMRVWLAAGFTLVCFLTAGILYSFITDKSQDVLNERSTELAVGRTVRLADRLSQPDVDAQAELEAANGEGYTAWYFDSTGSLIAPENPNAAWPESKGYEETLDLALEGERPSRDLQGGEIAIVGIPVTDIGVIQGAVVGRYSRPIVIRSAIDTLRSESLRAALIAILIGTLLGVGIASVITGRLKRIAAKADDLASGNFDVRLPVRGRDEIGDLARSLDSMRVALKESFGVLTADRDKLTAIFDGLGDAVMVIDDDGSVRFHNSAANALLEQGARAPEPMLFSIKRAATEGFAAHPALRIGDRAYALQARSLPDEGAVLVVVRDRTDEMRKEFAERDFVSNAAHELRNPLAGISGAIEVLQSGAKDDPPARDHFLNRLSADAERMSRLTQSLLTLARVEALGTGEVEVVDISAAVRDTAAAVEVPVGLELRTDVEPDLAAKGDPTLLRQVLIGLVTNACKNTPAPGSVTIRGRRIGETEMLLEVIDTGTGIPQAEIERVFERFYRRSETRRQEGFGLGLAIARRMADVMGGEMGANSVEGEGSTFWVRLPLIDQSKTPIA